jgi:hypothetical protein
MDEFLKVMVLKIIGLFDKEFLWYCYHIDGQFWHFTSFPLYPQRPITQGVRYGY